MLIIFVSTDPGAINQKTFCTTMTVHQKWGFFQFWKLMSSDDSKPTNSRERSHFRWLINRGYVWEIHCSKFDFVQGKELEHKHIKLILYRNINLSLQYTGSHFVQLHCLLQQENNKRWKYNTSKKLCLVNGSTFNSGHSSFCDTRGK